jgi:hypothetical protein
MRRRRKGDPNRLLENFAEREACPEALKALASDCNARADCGLSRVACSYAAIALGGSPPASHASPS